MKTRNYAANCIILSILTLTLAACKAKKEITKTNNEEAKIEVYNDTRKDTTSIVETKNEDENEQLITQTYTITYDTLQRPLEKKITTTKRIRTRTANDKIETQNRTLSTSENTILQTKNNETAVRRESKESKWWIVWTLSLLLLLILILWYVYRKIKK